MDTLEKAIPRIINRQLAAYLKACKKFTEKIPQKRLTEIMTTQRIRAARKLWKLSKTSKGMSSDEIETEMRNILSSMTDQIDFAIEMEIIHQKDNDFWEN